MIGSERRGERGRAGGCVFHDVAETLAVAAPPDRRPLPDCAPNRHPATCDIPAHRKYSPINSE
ncbi:hypothetical protein [Azospirillum argentinense]